MKRRTLRAFAAVLAAATCGAWADGPYRWIDEQGRVQTSDRPPPPGARQLPAADARSPGSAEDCQARWAAYQASQDCYARYSGVNGIKKAEAFPACGPPLPDPGATGCQPLTLP